MDGERGESLGSALREPNIGQRRLRRRFKNVIDAVGNVMESELVERIVPESSRKRR